MVQTKWYVFNFEYKYLKKNTLEKLDKNNCSQASNRMPSLFAVSETLLEEMMVKIEKYKKNKKPQQQIEENKMPKGSSGPLYHK